MINDIIINEDFCKLYINILKQKYPEIEKLLNNLDNGFIQSKGHYFLHYEVCDVLEKLNYSHDKVVYETQINSIESIDFIDSDDITNHVLFGIVVAMKIIHVWSRQGFEQKLIVYIVPTDENWMLIRCHEFIAGVENYYQMDYGLPILQIII